MNNDYGYELKYTCDNQVEVTMKIDGNIDTYDLANRLAEFLLACSWNPSAVAEIVNFDGSEKYREDIDE